MEAEIGLMCLQAEEYQESMASTRQHVEMRREGERERGEKTLLL